MTSQLLCDAFVKVEPFYEAVSNGLGDTPTSGACVMMPKRMGAVPKVLANDVFIIVNGKHMLRVFAKSFRATHHYLQGFGSENRIAPTKSYIFASIATATKWLGDTWWPTMNASTAVVDDFRYLGIHLSTPPSRGNTLRLETEWREH